MTQNDPLNTPVQYVKGVGPALSEKLSRLDVFTVADLLYLMPRRYLDRRQILPIARLAEGKDRTVRGKVITAGLSFLGRGKRRIYEVIFEDESGMISAKWFHFYENRMKQSFSVGSEYMVSGEVSGFGGKLQFIHPEIEKVGEDGEIEFAGRLLPVYPSTEGMYQKTIRRIVRNAWDNYGKNIKEVFPVYLREEHKLEDPWGCLQELHFPASDVDVDFLNEGMGPAHRTLIFSEFFFLELGLAIKRKKLNREQGIQFEKGVDQRDFIESLPFKLTGAQEKSVTELNSDMMRDTPMNRMLQGDVGSGKTIVSLISAMRAVENGYQAAIMAPTEILAEQHFRTISKFLEGKNITFALFTSGLKGSVRDELRKKLEKGKIDIAIGTHALIQKDIKFKKLGFVVIDEQHRFGVLQRMALKGKGGTAPDTLVMTATPIPRTLAMTLYGDLDLSIIDELPPGRMPIITRLYGEKQREKLYNGLGVELKRGHQAYVVYPLVEESEKLDLKNATQMTKELKKVFSPKFVVELIHGRMKPDQKDDIMHRYKSGEINMLVATSVVEVGVDVPNATVMVIEHAERFGLSQLHQLRGRVGRSDQQSYCILMADYKRSPEARHRLQAMVDTNDGFKIAEEDLKIRGPGDFLGTRQSGLPMFKIADLIRDVKLLAKARDCAFDLIDRDPELANPEHAGIKNELYSRWAGKLKLAEM